MYERCRAVINTSIYYINFSFLKNLIVFNNGLLICGYGT